MDDIVGGDASDSSTTNNVNGGGVDAGIANSGRACRVLDDGVLSDSLRLHTKFCTGLVHERMGFDERLQRPFDRLLSRIIASKNEVDVATLALMHRYRMAASVKMSAATTESKVPNADDDASWSFLRHRLEMRLEQDDGADRERTHDQSGTRGRKGRRRRRRTLQYRASDTVLANVMPTSSLPSADGQTPDAANHAPARQNAMYHLIYDPVIVPFKVETTLSASLDTLANAAVDAAQRCVAIVPPVTMNAAEQSTQCRHGKQSQPEPQKAVQFDCCMNPDTTLIASQLPTKYC